MEAVQDFIYDQNEADQAILQYLHEVIMATGEVTTKLRYRVPFYFVRSWICYLNPQKQGGVELVFLRGNELSNANGLLSARGRKQVAGVIYHRPEDVDEQALLETLQEALLLDETVKYESKRKKS